MTAARWLVIALFAVAGTADGGALIREEGATYLDDFLRKPVRIAVVADAPIFFDIGMSRYLGILRKLQVVELQAISNGAYRVKGQARQGGVLGWVEPKYLAPLDPKFLAAIKQNALRQKEVQALISKNEVAINLTTNEVLTSLGKPSKKTTRLDATGRHEVWEYVRFERVPQQITGADEFGRIVSSTIYVKVPAGQLSVIFDNNLVAALEQSEGTLLRDARTRIVAPPAYDFDY